MRVESIFLNSVLFYKKIFCFDENKTAPFEVFVSFDESCMRETRKSFEKSFGWRKCNRRLLCWDTHAKDDYDGHKNSLSDDFSFQGELVKNIF